MNKLRDISPLNSLTHLLTLKADRNLLNSAKLDEVSSKKQLKLTLNVHLPESLKQ